MKLSFTVPIEVEPKMDSDKISMRGSRGVFNVNIADIFSVSVLIDSEGNPECSMEPWLTVLLNSKQDILSKLFGNLIRQALPNE